uniref:4-hydroxy-tetrahydrodipicolinate synthase n=1 Tax=uncultured myxobacterium HF0200_05J13 TaxID=723557 RepID=E7C3K8_9BACT|nr:dihydrodipicolinate synthase/N-acetylneuraminate lyase [uncultured myxobacterium HF0200_05J13]
MEKLDWNQLQKIEDEMMSSQAQLNGVLTALVTPMNADGSVDFGALDALVDSQIEAGIDGLVPCGTTGESATMTAEEREQVIAHVVKRANGECTIVAGAGSNSTAVAIEHQKRAAGTGADYALVVTPYYNKPTPTGLYKHYEALLGAADIPIILYNVPGRTGCDMLPETVINIAQMDGIVSVKEATADLDRVSAIRAGVSEEFKILSGDDETTCPFVLLGGDGVISVTSNFAPAQMVAMVHAARARDVETARRQHETLRPLFEVLFIESNPIPVKTALAMAGQLEENFRLPLCAISAPAREELTRVLKQGSWLS